MTEAAVGNADYSIVEALTAGFDQRLPLNGVVASFRFQQQLWLSNGCNWDKSLRPPGGDRG
jgi:hypothetical protein